MKDAHVKGNRKSLRNIFRRTLSVVLAITLVGSSLQAISLSADESIVSYFAETALELTPERMEAFQQIQESRTYYGLVGFEGAYALPNDATPVGVIVLFENSTAAVQVLEAQVEGYALALEAAEQIVEDDHARFRRQLGELFAPRGRAMGASFAIEWEYRLALNGSAVTIPANMVEVVANLPGVRAVFPDYMLHVPEIIFDEDSDMGLSFPNPLDTPTGMRQGRARMEADYLHAMGITGEGVLVAVLDTGVNWMHPTFAGTFPTAEWMAARGVHISQDELLNINVYAYGLNMGLPVTGGTPQYYFVGRDFMQTNQANIARPDEYIGELRNLWITNDPMETGPMHRLWDMERGVPLSGGPTWAQMTDHGSHVAGTIVGQAVEGHGANAILGVAPGAKAIHYRVLGFGGSGGSSGIIAGMEFASKDSADVVNMSLGGGIGCSMRLNTMAINNIMLANPNITFVNSAGNGGPNLFTLGNPGASTLAITVSNLLDHGVWSASSFAFHGGTFTGDVSLFAGDGRWGADTQWTELSNGNVVFNNNLENTIGIQTIYAIPHYFTQVVSAAPNRVGIGAPADFVGLVREHVNPNFNPPIPANIDDPTTAGWDVFLEALAEIDYFEGSWVLTRRPFTFVSSIAMANALGMAGIVQTNNALGVPNIAAANAHVPFMSLPIAVGTAFEYYILNDADGVGNFRITSPVLGVQSLANGSSRGPVRVSYEIKPDIGAHGSNVFSASTSWRIAGSTAANWFGRMNDLQGDFVDISYRLMSGTSMSAPHVAGAVALMIQASTDNGSRWTNEEIKTRMMNTAMSLQNPNYGPFDGARQLNVRRAIEAEEFVYVSLPFVNAVDDNFVTDRDVNYTARTGSFSFRRVPEGTSATLPMTIVNESNVRRAYTITAVPNLTTRLSQPDAAFNSIVGQTHMVNPGQRVTLPITITLPEDSAGGHFVGYIVVSDGDRVVATLPYAAVAIDASGVGPVVENMFLARPVISTGDYVHKIFAGLGSDGERTYHTIGSYLTVMFTANATFEMDIEVYRIVENGEDIRISDLDATFFFPSLTVALQTSPLNQHRGVIAFGEGLELDEGEYRLVLNIMHNIGHGWQAAQEPFEFTFWVDNTPPVLEDMYLTIDGVTDPIALDIEGTTTISSAQFEQADYIIVTGNVRDYGLEAMIDAGATFDIWVDNARREASVENNLAVFVGLTPIEHNTVSQNLPGLNYPSASAASTQTMGVVTSIPPVRAEIDPITGDFSATISGLADVDEPWTITVWAIDNFSPHAVFNANMLVPPVYATSASSRASVEFMPDHMLLLHPGNANFNNLPTDIHTAFSGTWWTQNSVTRTRHGWIGSNIVGITTTVVAQAPVLSFDIFNNGPGGSASRPNAGLAAAGTIRMWTQLDGVNTPVPYAELTVTAELPDGTCAMEFIRVNNMWANPGNANLIDVNKNGAWQRIYLTATLFGQDAEVVLVNSRFLGLVAFNNGTDAEVPSMAGNIRIWPLLNDESAPIPMDAVITAVDQDGGDAMAFVTKNRLWTDAGWQDYNSNFDVTKDAPWQTIYFTITVYGQTVSVLLINDWFEDATEPSAFFGLNMFNNGIGGSPSRPNANLAQAGTIRIWTQLDGENALVPYTELTVVAELSGGTCAMEFVRINRIWNNPGYVNLIDINKNAPWPYIEFSITLFGQTVELLLVNDQYTP